MIRNSLHERFGFLIVLASFATLGIRPVLAQDAIPIAKIKHDGAVDFEKEVLPILRRNCLACHSSTKAESKLIMESPASILKGGDEGPGVVAGKPAESLVLLLASRQRESFMPPDDNNVGAKKLTSEELGLLQLWIEQGAKGEVASKNKTIQWQPLPAGVNPIYAVAMTDDGQFAAAGRANQIFMYHVPSGRELGRLHDPALAKTGLYQHGVADLELIQSLAFSPDGQRLVSGGFRTAKIWNRQPSKLADISGVAAGVQAVAISADGKWAAVGEASGAIRFISLTENKVVASATGHSGAITGLAFSLDGQQVYSSSLDKSCRAWKIDGTVIWTVETATPLHAISIVDDGKRVVVSCEDHQLRVWDLPVAGQLVNKEPVQVLSGHSQKITSLAALKDGLFASGSRDGSARLWQSRDGKQIREINHAGPIDSVSATADGSKLATTSADQRTTKIWNTADGKLLHELRGDFAARYQEAAETRGVALAKRHIDLANADLKAANERKTAEETSAKKADEDKKKADEELAKKVEASKKPVADKEAAEKSLAALKTQLASSEAETKKAQELAAAIQELVKKIAETSAAAEKSATESGDRAAADVAKLVAAKIGEAADQQKKFIEVLAGIPQKIKTTEESIKTLTTAAQKAIEEKTAAERAAETATRAVERAKMAIQRAADEIPPLDAIAKQRTQEHQAVEAKLVETKKGVAAAAKAGRQLAISADGKTLTVAVEGGSILIYDIESGSVINELLVTTENSSIAAPLADGRLISFAASGATTLWSALPQWSLQRTIGSVESTEIFVDRVTALATSPDGKLLATGTGEPSRSGELTLWDLSTGELVRKIPDAHSDSIFSIDFSRDGERIVTSAADRFVKVFKVSDGKFERSFEGHTHHVLGVAWSADGRILSSSGADKVVKVWNAITGDQQRTIQGFNKEVTAVRFLGDTDQVIATCGDSTVQLVRADNGSNVRKFAGPSDFMYSVDATADGSTIVAGGRDSIVRIWNQDGRSIANFEAPKP